MSGFDFTQGVVVTAANAVAFCPPLSSAADTFLTRSATGVLSVTDVFGNAGTFGGTILTALPDGTVGVPAIHWTNDGNSGLYRLGANNNGFSIASTLVFDWNATRLLTSKGYSLNMQGATSGVVTVKPQAVAGTWTFQWPNSVGSANQVLTTDGTSGVMSWTTASGVAGNNNDIQYKAAGAQAGSDNFTFDGTKIVTIGGALSLGVTSAEGLILTNTTAAAVGAQQWSPRLHFIGSGWKTNATAGAQTLDFIQELQVVQGSASAIPQMTFSYQRNGAGYNIAAQFTDAAGQTTGNVGYLQLNLGSAGNGSIAPISTVDHINVTRGGSSGATIGFGTFNASADIGQIGIAIAGMTGVANAPAFTSIGPSNPVGLGTGDASGANTAGGNTTVFGGRSTGSGLGGSIVFQTSPAAGSSSTVTALATALTIDSTKKATFAGPVVIPTSTVASLPASPVEGMLYGVTDANSTTFNAAVVGGGANHVLAYYNGSGWVIGG